MTARGTYVSSDSLLAQKAQEAFLRAAAAMVEPRVPERLAEALLWAAVGLTHVVRLNGAERARKIALGALR